jgi:hypothetical protein
MGWGYIINMAFRDENGLGIPDTYDVAGAKWNNSSDAGYQYTGGLYFILLFIVTANG